MRESEERRRLSAYARFHVVVNHPEATLFLRYKQKVTRIRWAVKRLCKNECDQFECNYLIKNIDIFSQIKYLVAKTLKFNSHHRRD